MSTGRPKRSTRTQRQQSFIELEDSSSDSSSNIQASKRKGKAPARGCGKGKASASRGGVKKAVRKRRMNIPAGAAEDIHNLIDTKKEKLRERVSKLSGDESKELLIKVIENQPGLICHLLESSGTPGQGYHPPSSTASPEWCSCGNCREMPKPEERVCCMKSPEDCISNLPDMQVLILDEGVLALARLLYRDMTVLPEDDDINRGKRHTAYRQYILWQFGYLGEGVRVVIPSCCTWKIRDKFPDSFGQYKGFLPARIEG